MFDIGFPELVLAGIIALIILGPERLPGALRTMGLWLGRLRRGYYRAKTEIEKEIGMDEVRRQLHNEQIMEDVRRMEQEVNAIGSDIAGDAASPPAGTAQALDGTAQVSDGTADALDGPVQGLDGATQAPAQVADAPGTQGDDAVPAQEAPAVGDAGRASSSAQAVPERTPPS